MTIEQIPADCMIFIDANIFIYHFTLQSASCARLLRRCQDSEIKGFTSVGCVAEMLHRLMIAEAIQKGYVTTTGVVRKLKENPEIVKKLDQYQQAPNRLLEMKITVLPIKDKSFSIFLSLKIRANMGKKIKVKVFDGFGEEHDIETPHDITVIEADSFHPGQAQGIYQQTYSE